MAKKYYSKDFIKLTGVTKKALRYYEDKGLITPTKEAQSGYRIYQPNDLLIIHKIQIFKAMGYTISEIKVMLGYADSAILKELSTQKESMANHIKKLQEILNLIQQMESSYKHTGKISWGQVITMLNLTERKNILNKEFTHILTEDEIQQAIEIGDVRTDQVEQSLLVVAEYYAQVKQYLAENPSSKPTDKNSQVLAAKWWALIKQNYTQNPTIFMKIWKARIDKTYPEKYLPEFYDEQVSLFMYEAVIFYRNHHPESK